MLSRLCAVRPFCYARVFASTVPSDKTIYSFRAKNIDGEEVSLEKYRGKVVIIVNTASECRYTGSNYNQFKLLLDKYKQQGLKVAAFPCNQFGKQEPGCYLDIKSFVKNTFKYEPDLFSKIDVNGDNAHPLFKFLKKEQKSVLEKPVFSGDIEWNFTKFLINRQGKLVGCYAPATEPKEMVKDIEKALKESSV